MGNPAGIGVGNPAGGAAGPGACVSTGTDVGAGARTGGRSVFTTGLLRTGAYVAAAGAGPPNAVFGRNCRSTAA